MEVVPTISPPNINDLTAQLLDYCRATAKAITANHNVTESKLEQVVLSAAFQEIVSTSQKSVIIEVEDLIAAFATGLAPYVWENGPIEQLEIVGIFLETMSQAIHAVRIAREAGADNPN